jgi:hypothetical protein
MFLCGALKDDNLSLISLPIGILSLMAFKQAPDSQISTVLVLPKLSVVSGSKQIALIPTQFLLIVRLSKEGGKRSIVIAAGFIVARFKDLAISKTWPSDVNR